MIDEIDPEVLVLVALMKESRSMRQAERRQIYQEYLEQERWGEAHAIAMQPPPSDATEEQCAVWRAASVMTIGQVQRYGVGIPPSCGTRH